MVTVVEITMGPDTRIIVCRYCCALLQYTRDDQFDPNVSYRGSIRDEFITCPSCKNAVPVPSW
jgi:hypothetical protein